LEQLNSYLYVSEVVRLA